MTGSTKDPANGPEVAASVFAAVIVYAVRLALPNLRQQDGFPLPLALDSIPRLHPPSWTGSFFYLAVLTTEATVFPRLLRLPSLPTCTIQ